MEGPRALGFLEALESGLQIEASDWRAIVPLHVAWAAPLSVLHLLVAALFGGGFQDAVARLAQAQRFDPDLLPYASVMIVLGALQSFGAILLRVALARRFARRLLARPEGEPPFAWLRDHLAGATGTALRLLIVLFAAFGLFVLSVTVGSTILGVGVGTGVLGVGFLAGAAGIGVACVGGFLAVRWGVRACLAPVVFAVEEGPAQAALARSRILLTPGEGRVLAVLLLSILASTALEQGFGVLLAGAGQGEDPRLSAAATTFFLFAWLPFEAYFTRVLTVLYFDRRVRREAFETAPADAPDSAASA